MDEEGQYMISDRIHRYFRESLWVESHQEVHKTIKKLGISTEEELAKLYPFYSSSNDFYQSISDY